MANPSLKVGGWSDPTARPTATLGGVPWMRLSAVLVSRREIAPNGVGKRMRVQCSKRKVESLSMSRRILLPGCAGNFLLEGMEHLHFNAGNTQALRDERF